jgi:hypothetical protein
VRQSQKDNNKPTKELTTVFILFFLFAFDRDFTTPTNSINDGSMVAMAARPRIDIC